MDINATETLDKAVEKFIRKGDMGPRREAARAITDFFTLNADYAFPMFEIVKKAVAIYDINHGNAEGRGVNRESVMQVPRDVTVAATTSFCGFTVRRHRSSGHL